MNNEIQDIIMKEMDLSDRETLKKMSLIQEADQNQFLVALTSKLYDKIQEKAIKIDFSTVEGSRGDITKIQNYASIVECLDIIRKIVIEYKQDPYNVDVVINAINNTKNRTGLYKKAFSIGSSLPILTYNSICVAIVQSVSFLIATCIEYIKTPNNESFQMALDTVGYAKTKDNVIFNTLKDYNRSCDNKDLDNSLSMVMNKSLAKREAADIELDKQAVIAKDAPFLSDEDIQNGVVTVIHDEDRDKERKRQLQEGIGSFISFAFTKAVMAVYRVILPIIRVITYLWFSCKQKMSNYYQDQADFLQMNAYQLQYNESLSNEEKEAIYKKQLKKIEKLKKRANELSVDYNTGKKKTEGEIKNDEKKIKVNDLDNPGENKDTSSLFEAEINYDIEDMKFKSPFKAASIEDRLAEAVKHDMTYEKYISRFR